MGLVNLAKKYAKYTILYTLVLIIITSSYVVTDGLFHYTLRTEKAILLITSPFNSGYEGQYINNVGFVFAELMLIELYFTIKERKNLLKWSFIAGILSSYVTALIYLNLTTSPAAGSSIVAASLLVIAFLAVIYDFITSAKNLWENRQNRELVVLPIVNRNVNKYGVYLVKVVWYLFWGMAIPLYVYGAFFTVAFVGKISFVLHEVGIILFLGILFGFYLLFHYKELIPKGNSKEVD